MGHSPTVTVVIATLNRADKLRTAVDSVLRQTYQDFEIVIVDDGSTDNTEEVVSAIPDPRVRFVKNPKNLGLSAARNVGTKHAKGRWIAIQDSDDEWLPHKLEKQMARLLPDEDKYVAAYCGLTIVGPLDKSSGERTRIRYVPDSDIPTDQLDGTLLPIALSKTVASSQTLVIRRDVLEEIGGWDAELPRLVDWDCVIRLARRGPLAFVDEPLVLQFFSSDSMTHSRDLRVKARERVLTKNMDLLEKEPEILTRIYRVIAGEYRLLGNFRNSRAAAWKAVRLSPTNPRLWAMATYVSVRALFSRG